MKHTLTLFLLIAFAQVAFAQEPHWSGQILEKTKGKKVISWEKPTVSGLPWVAVVKTKKTVGIYTVEIEEDYDLDGNDSSYVSYVYNNIEPKYEQIKDFNIIKEEDSDLVDELQGQRVEVAEVQLKKKTGIIVRYGDEYETMYLDAQMFFQKIDWENNKGTLVPVQNNDLWGIYDWFERAFLFECEYASIDDLPKTTDPNGFNAYSARIFNAFNKRKDWEEIDNIDLDNGNGDAIFLAQSKSTNKFGMYQYIDDKTIIEAVPMKYDSIYYYSWNGSFTAVFNEGKVGIYLSYWSYDHEANESVPCIYENYKILNKEEDNTKVLAVKKDGKWGWIDWLTGEEKSEFIYNSTDDLPYPHYKQNYWFDE